MSTVPAVAHVFPSVAAVDLPWLTVDQMVEADRLAIDEFDIELLQMMEHAGSRLAELTLAITPTGRIIVLAGGGNNGGGGLCAARHLINRGRRVQVVLSGPPGPAAEHHLGTLAEMGVEPDEEPGPAEIVVDAMVGYGLDGPLRGKAAGLAGWIGSRHVIALDFPSGHGAPGAVVPDATLTLALPKKALRGVEPIYLADLGLPAALWKRMGLAVGPLFNEGSILRVEVEDGPIGISGGQHDQD